MPQISFGNIHDKIIKSEPGSVAYAGVSIEGAWTEAQRETGFMERGS